MNFYISIFNIFISFFYQYIVLIIIFIDLIFIFHSNIGKISIESIGGGGGGGRLQNFLYAKIIARDNMMKPITEKTTAREILQSVSHFSGREGDTCFMIAHLFILSKTSFHSLSAVELLL